ncbi:MAG: serine hydrolase domain-containing protein [Bacteroidota bacterium]
MASPKKIFLGLGIVAMLLLGVAFSEPWRGQPSTTSLSARSTATEGLDSLVRELMDTYHIPGVSMALLKEGELWETHTYGVVQAGKPEPITTQTMFSQGSVSKVVNAMVVLSLVDQGKLALDRDVNEYLSQWQVDYRGYEDGQPVTLRTLLSHTAGFSVHGFADYLPGEELPNTIEILQSSGPAKNDPVRLIFAPGTSFKYSGGGITILQLLVEEITGKPYAQAAHEILFAPVGLARSSYENPLPPAFGDIAKAHNPSGNPVAQPRGYESMPEMAASGLWSCPTDIATLLAAYLKSYTRQPGGLFSTALAQDMATANTHSAFGLGPKTETRDGHKLLFHNGANDSYRAHFTLSLTNQTGYIIMTNGTQGLSLVQELKPALEALLW